MAWRAGIPNCALRELAVTMVAPSITNLEAVASAEERRREVAQIGGSLPHVPQEQRMRWIASANITGRQIGPAALLDVRVSNDVITVVVSRQIQRGPAVDNACPRTSGNPERTILCIRRRHVVLIGV